MSNEQIKQAAADASAAAESALTERPAASATEATASPPAAKLPVHTPRTDVFQTAKATVVVMDLPGVGREDLDIETENQSLRITAKAPAPLSEGKQWLRREFRGRRYARTFRIGNRVDTEQMTARLVDGVLTVNLPYKAQTMAKKIEISG